MEQPLSDQLHTICRALLKTLSETVSGEILACDLVQIDRREFHFQSVAAAHFPGGSVRRVLLGCEERLAEYLSSGGANPPDAAADNPVHDGLRALCQKFQANLSNSGMPWAGDQEFLIHDHQQFRVHCSGVRNFLFRVAVAEGRLDLVLDIAPRPLDCEWLAAELSGQGQTQVNTSASAITNPALVQRIMLHLASSGADVQVKLPAEGDRLELLQATFLAHDLGPETEQLPLTCARRTSLERAEDVPDKVTIVFILQDKLLQCTCPVLEHDHAWLDDDISLPILRLGLPGSITFGQRRGAFRLEPPERIKGTVRRQVSGDAIIGMVGKRIPMQVVDISFTGAMLHIGSQAIISGFKGGAEVVCVIQLPPKYGEVSLEAVVRRLHVSHDDGRRGASLGIEFIDDPEVKDLSVVRRYIQDRHASDLADGTAELTIG